MNSFDSFSLFFIRAYVPFSYTWHLKPDKIYHGVSILDKFKTLKVVFPGGSVVKNVPANAGDSGDTS